MQHISTVTKHIILQVGNSPRSELQKSENLRQVLYHPVLVFCCR